MTTDEASPGSPGMLLEVAGSLTCHSDTMRVLGEGWGRKIVLLSMFGPRNAVRAAWATLSKSTGRRGRGSIDVGGTSVMMHEGVMYSTVTAPIGRGLLHSVTYHQMLSRNAPDAGYFFQVEPRARIRYFDRLARWCPVPLRAAWCEPLWGIGVERGAIAEIAGHGLGVWRVATTRETWEPIVRYAIATGGLK